jgi:lipopolysaccharide export LptBFGC system permease protein LptF
LEVEQGRRWALPLACLAFAVLGLPLAVATRGARGSGYLVTLGAFILFYTLSRMGIALAENGALAPLLAAFLPDLAVAALGAGFTLKLLETGVGKPRG